MFWGKRKGAKKYFFSQKEAWLIPKWGKKQNFEKKIHLEGFWDIWRPLVYTHGRPLLKKIKPHKNGVPVLCEKMGESFFNNP